MGVDTDYNNTDLWTKSMWKEGGGTTTYYPHTGADKAWFNDGTYGGVGNNATLDVSVTLSSMLFNGSYTVSKDTDSGHGSETITLNSTIAADSQIQVIAGTSSVAPDIIMAAGDPLITVGIGRFVDP